MARSLAGGCAWAVAVAVGGALVLGCETVREVGAETVHQANPFDVRGAEVLSTEPHGYYLLTELGGMPRKLRFLTPRDAACLQVLKPEASVSYGKHGVFGRLYRDDLSCDAVGSASLAAWRDRGPRQTRLGASPVPRAQATFGTIASDEQYVQLRGRFPLAGRIGIPAGVDLVAFVSARNPTCRGPVGRGVASMELRHAGTPALSLVGDGGLCPIEALAQPLTATETR